MAYSRGLKQLIASLR